MEIKPILSTLQDATAGNLATRLSHAEVPKPLADALNAFLATEEQRVARLAYAATSLLLALQPTRSVWLNLVNTIHQQAAKMNDIVRLLKVLETRSEEMTQIVEILDDVASQTNVLALNAAIEAARGGAQGKGFGLIAEEVRKVADRSASATKDVGAFLETISAAAGDASRQVEDAHQLAEKATRLGQTESEQQEHLERAIAEVSQALNQIRTTDDESHLARLLHENRTELTKALDPLTPLVAHDSTPLGSAIRKVLAALGGEPVSNP